MGYKITALFVDSRREFPHQFSEALWPQIQFTRFERVGRIVEAVQRHIAEEFNICFISDRGGEKLDDFFLDIAKLGRNKTCIFVKLLSADTATTGASTMEAGFHLTMHDQPTAEDLQALQNTLGIVWHKVEVDRRGSDIDGLVDLLIKMVDDAAANHKRGRGTHLKHGATSLVRMHAEFDSSILDQFMSRLSDRASQSAPVRKALKSVPLPLLSRNLPELSEGGYHGTSSRVFNMLLDKFGEPVKSAAGTGSAPQAAEEPPVLDSPVHAEASSGHKMGE